MRTIVTLEWCINRWGIDKVRSEVNIDDPNALQSYLQAVQDWVDGMGD